jgi:CRP/FNR family transcriptional regulator, anaerobic regulatory protein
MTDSFRFALHREELSDALVCGDHKIARLPGIEPDSIKAGSILIKQGDPHDYVYRLTSGWMARRRDMPYGGRQFILIFLPGDMFAVKSMFLASHPDAVVALTDALVDRIGQRELRRAYEDDGDIATRCMWQVVEEERRLHNWMVAMGYGNAEERMALLFTETRNRLSLSGEVKPGALEFEVPMTQLQMGEFLGLSTVHVNRVLRWLRETGVATKRGRKVSIQDMDALAALADPFIDEHERTVLRSVAA